MVQSSIVYGVNSIFTLLNYIQLLPTNIITSVVIIIAVPAVFIDVLLI